eukprot:TRINITY_DN4163_c0_g1_i2.p1 TRINITY_DN4163_c0_g1~~TRINITY_DN4163_c0_g1_i2.p1  ORF type:complete len:167 (+),score=32.36 TRINITY_DN4163_c0_g1_i2:182-682(+)
MADPAASDGAIKQAQQERPQGDLEIKPVLDNFKVVPKVDEVQDANFPKSLHQAAQLFMMTQNIALAKRLVVCVNLYLVLFEGGPDGKSQHQMGDAVVCWLCGHVALPKGEQYEPPAETTASPPGCPLLDSASVKLRCAGCSSDEETNRIHIAQPDGTKLPWIQMKR